MGKHFNNVIGITARGNIMKRLSIYIFSLIISFICLLPINAVGYTYPNNYKWEYSHDKGTSGYYNVNIGNIYYNIDIYDDQTGRKGTYNVSVNFAKTKGNTLTIPETIFFKGRNLKVKEINIDDMMLGANNRKWKMPYKKIVIPNTVESADFRYAKFTKLKKIYIPKKTQVIDGLSDYPKLKVIIDKKNPYIKMKNGAIYSKNGKKLLSLVNSKKTYRVSKGTKQIDFSGVKKLEKVYLPKSLETITLNAFRKCRNLKTVKINNKTKKIGSCAFENCGSLKKITIPKNIKKIKGSAFCNCKELSTVIIENEKNSPKVIIEYEGIKSSAFKNTKDGIQFIVKNQTVADQLKEQLQNNKSGVKNAKILIGKKVVYQNIHG